MIQSIVTKHELRQHHYFGVLGCFEVDKVAQPKEVLNLRETTPRTKFVRYCWIAKGHGVITILTIEIGKYLFAIIRDNMI
jgi:hypothetical protein